MTYQKDITGVLQTATRDAAIITAAEIAAGIVKSHDTAVKRFEELRDTVLLPPLQAAVETDNAMFKAEEAADEAAGKGKSRGRGGAKGGSKSSGSGDGTWLETALADPGAVVIKGGKFDGKTVSFVYDLPASAAEEYGYTDQSGNAKAGSKYIQWMTTNEKNPKMAQVAKAFIDSKRAADAA